MTKKKLTDFDLSTSFESGDYLIGYKADATKELRTTFQTIQNSLPDLFKYQGTDLKDLSGNWESTYTLMNSNSATWEDISTTVQTNSASWNQVYTTVQANSATWDIDTSVDTELRDLSATWQDATTVVQTNSANSWDNSLSIQYAHSNFLPLSGGNLTGSISLSNVVVEPGQTITECLSSLVITINGQQFKVPLLAI